VLQVSKPIETPNGIDEVQLHRDKVSNVVALGPWKHSVFILESDPRSFLADPERYSFVGDVIPHMLARSHILVDLEHFG